MSHTMGQEHVCEPCLLPCVLYSLVCVLVWFSSFPMFYFSSLLKVLIVKILLFLSSMEELKMSVPRDLDGGVLGRVVERSFDG
jgi:hypothetical protein